MGPVSEYGGSVLRLGSSICGSPALTDMGLRSAEGPGGRDVFKGLGPRRRFQTRFGRRLEEVAKAVRGGYCRLQMPLKLALAVRGTVAGHRLGAVEGGRGVPPRPPMHPCLGLTTIISVWGVARGADALPMVKPSDRVLPALSRTRALDGVWGGGLQSRGGPPL